MFASNPFALLAEDAAPVVVAKKAAAPAAAPAKPVKETKEGEGKRSPQGDRRRGDAPRGRGGRASAPRAPREANTEDFTGGESSERAPRSAPRGDRALRGDRAPRGEGRGEGRAPRRQFDRHSGTGREDGEKKEVAGASWGDAIESTGATEGWSAEQNLVAAEKVGEEGEKPEAKAAAPAEEEDKTKSYADYQKEIAAKKAALKAKPARKANEGVEDASFKTGEVLTKKGLDEAGELTALLAGSKKKAEPKKKERKEKQLITDIKLQFTAEAAPRRGGDRDDRRGGFRGGRGGARSAPAAGARPQGSVNINDSKAFPALA